MLLSFTLQPLFQKSFPPAFLALPWLFSQRLHSSQTGLLLKFHLLSCHMPCAPMPSLVAFPFLSTHIHSTHLRGLLVMISSLAFHLFPSLAFLLSPTIQGFPGKLLYFHSSSLKSLMLLIRIQFDVLQCCRQTEAGR